MILRVQDRDGRGPFKPGMSAKWCDASDAPQFAPMYEEFGTEIVGKMQDHLDKHGGAFGCGCRTRAKIDEWFTKREQIKLASLGYALVSMQEDSVFAESPDQVVFWRKRPLRNGAIVIPWFLPMAGRSLPFLQPATDI